MFSYCFVLRISRTGKWQLHNANDIGDNWKSGKLESEAAGKPKYKKTVQTMAQHR